MPRPQRRNWKIAGGGYGIHCPEIDEDISTEGLLRGAPAPRVRRHYRGSSTRQRKGGAASLRMTDKRV